MKLKNTAITGQGRTHPKESHSGINGNNFAALVPVISSLIGLCHTNVVSAKALHCALGVGRDFTTWIKARIKQYGFKEGVDYVIVEDLSSPVSGSTKARQQREYGYQLISGGDDA